MLRVLVDAKALQPFIRQPKPADHADMIARQITLLSEGIQPQQESEKSDRLPYPPNPINHKLIHTIKNNRRSQSMTEQ